MSPPQNYGHQAPIHQAYPPPPQQLGYGPPPSAPAPYGTPQQPPINVSNDVNAIYKACKGFGTNERALINIFAHRDGPTIDAIRRGYTYGDLISLLEKEISGDFRTVMVATALGPLESHSYFAHKAMTGAGTNEDMLTEAIMGRSGGEIAALKSVYHARYHTSLEADVRSDLSMKTEKMFLMALAVNSGGREEEWTPVPPPHQVQAGVSALYQATRGRLGTDEITVCGIFTRLNDQHIRALAYEYERMHRENLMTVIKREFSGHMKNALLYIIEGALNKAQRDACLLEDSMKGFGTKDDLLIQRVVRIHWDRMHLENVKNAYKKLYGRDLYSRIKGETGGYYREMLLELVK